MNDEQVKNKTDILRETLANAIQEALSEAGEEILLNKWVFVADLIIDGDRTLVPVWDGNMDALDIESLLAPAYRMAQNITDMHTIGIAAEALEYIGEVPEEDDEDEDEDD